MKNISNIRKDYQLRSLSEDETSADPFKQFEHWWNDAIASDVPEVNAMTLATVDAHGRPSARIVLLKGLAPDGFHFFSNYESRKAQDLTTNKYAALVFFWKELERQVRIEGTVTKLSAADSDEYFLSRPYESRAGAWISPQSRVIASRKELEDKLAEAERNRDGAEIARPDFWGGYTVSPTLFEFWQGRPNRLHDRIAYTKTGDAWRKDRLAP